MGGLLAVSRVIDRINSTIGRYLSWLVLVAVVISAGNAIIRKVFDQSSNAWLEAQWYLFGAVFLGCAAWTLLANEHIRIDIVNGMLPKRVRDWIDVVGHVLFLLPFTILMLVTSWPFFLNSFRLNEQSMNAGGLVVWPAKFLLIFGFTLLLFQGLSELIKRVAVMRGLIPDPHASGGHHAAAEAEAERLLAAVKAEAAKHQH